jgi:aerobic carbon-monoxide dehydrogenase medium subunit
MKPARFVYKRPTTVEEVVALLAEHGSDARVLAGGQSLVPIMNLRLARPEVLIDLNRCEGLSEIETADGGLRFGAMVRQWDAMEAELTRRTCPLVSKALSFAGPVAVRNRATVGGTLAHSDRSAELPGVAVALGASLILQSASGQRVLPAEEFFVGDMETAAETGEFLRAAVFPETAPEAFTGFLEVGLRREGIAVAGMAATVMLDERGHMRKAGLAVTGVEPVPVRLKSVEADLIGRKLDAEAIEFACGMVADLVDPIDDAYTSAAYRKVAARSLLRRLLRAAAQLPEEHHA